MCACVCGVCSEDFHSQVTLIYGWFVSYLIWLNIFEYPQDDLLEWTPTLYVLEKNYEDISQNLLAGKDVLHQFATLSIDQLMCCWHIQLIKPSHNAAKETFRPDPGWILAKRRWGGAHCKAKLILNRLSNSVELQTWSACAGRLPYSSTWLSNLTRKNYNLVWKILCIYVDVWGGNWRASAICQIWLDFGCSGPGANWWNELWKFTENLLICHMHMHKLMESMRQVWK